MQVVFTRYRSLLGPGQYKHTVSRQLVEHLSSARDNLLFKPYQNGSKTPENQGFPGFYYI